MRGALRDAIHVVHPREADVKGDGLWALGLGVVVRLEVLGPPVGGVALLLRREDRGEWFEGWSVW